MSWLVVLAALLGCSAAATDATAPPNSAPAAVVITPSTPAIPLGSQLALQAEVHDASGKLVSGATVFWSSSDTAVATVSPTGVVTGKSLGSAQVAASAGGQSAVVAVSVVPVSVASVSVLPAVSTLVVGGTVTLQAVAYDANGSALSGRSTVWASSDSRIATVDASGKVVGVAAGTATISATSGGKTGSATVTVTLLPVAAVVVSPGSATIAAGQTASFSAVATDPNGNTLSGRPLTWSSSSTAVAQVSSAGLVTAIAAGSTTITATAEGKTGAAQVVVTAPAPVPVASVTVNPASTNLTIGSSAMLTATMRSASGATLSGRAVTWVSSAPQIATVSSAGRVTAIAPGNATITATSEGVSGNAQVSVPAPVPARVASIRVTPSTLSLDPNHSATLTAQLFDSSGNQLSGRTIIWTSSNSGAVSVASSGASTATVHAARNAEGSVTITAASEGVTGSATVRVSH